MTASSQPSERTQILEAYDQTVAELTRAIVSQAKGVALIRNGSERDWRNYLTSDATIALNHYRPDWQEVFDA